ncbi:MAG: substrate-binding domain-containing protein [Streptosporangiales bacterium]|nr:substrate-binding domain-containing protein [Streptosporangiales bacterium]
MGWTALFGRPAKRTTWRSGAAALAGLALFAVGACSSPSPSGGGGDEGQDTFTIGVSNGFVGSEWRTQMLDDVRTVFDTYKQQGVVDELVVESADVDVNGQIQQIRNLINTGVDAIIVNPNSPTALNAVFTEAKQKGILVVATDQAVQSQDVTNVVIDQGEWARRSAEWLAEQLEAGDSVGVVNGVDGHPANEARWAAARQALEDGQVKIETVTNGDWDQATGQQVTSNMLASHPDLDGIWTQDGMALGVFQAVKGAGKLDDLVLTGEARVGFMRQWADQRQQGDFETIGVVNPPGVAGSALHIAVRMLQDKQLKSEVVSDGNTVYVPIPDVVTNENFDELWAEVQDEPDAYALDGTISAREADTYFR